MNVSPRPATRIALAAFVLLALGTALWGALPLSPKPTNALPAEFSGERALNHSRKFAIEPRARGGAAAARGRDYIYRECQALGLEVEIQRDPVNHATSVNFVENVIARIPGTDNKNTIGMTAHYDSVAWGPGAADDGAGVVVMLEVARALKCMPAFRNDVVFIFTGDEEGGGNGSVKSLSHRWLKDLNIMIGLEGRGDWGTPYMFETSHNNLQLMQEMAKMDIPAVANSIMYQAHSRTPNTTDFTHMVRHGALGYNVAFVGGLQYYHTANDSHEHLSPSTLQHQGEYVMSIVKHYGNDGPKVSESEQDAVFFNTIGHHLVVYPFSYAKPISIASVVIFLLGLIIAFATRGIRILGLLGGILIIIVVLAVTAAVCWPLQWATYKLFYVYIMYNAAYYHLAFILFGVALTLAALSWVRNRITPEELHAASLFLWLANLGALTYLELHIASYSGAWPLLIGSVGLALACLLRRFGAPRGVTVPVQVFSSMPPVFFLVPGTHALYHFGGAITPIATAGLVIVTLFALAPGLQLIFSNGLRWTPRLLTALALVIFVIGCANQRYTRETPKMNTLTYGLNLDTQQAIWLTSDKVSDEWVAQFIPNDTASEAEFDNVLPGHNEWARHAPAPVAPLAAPQLSAVSDTTNAEGKRELVLKYVTTRSPEEARISVLNGARVLTASVDGMGDVLADTNHWNLHVGYLPYNGEMTFRIVVDRATVNGPLQVRIQETNFHLPELSTLGYRPRPEWMISRGNTLGWWEKDQLDPNHTYLVKTFNF